MYHEVSPPARWPWVVAGLYVVLLLPNVWLPELSTREAVNALIARDVVEYGNVLTTTMMGQPTVHPPLVAWLLALLTMVMPMGEMTVRLVDLLALGGMSAICAGMLYRTIGIQAACAASVACISCLLCIDRGPQGDGTMLFAFCLNCAWMVWYLLSRDHRRWLYAWFFAHLLVCVAMLAGGPKAFLYFYFPLFFLKRPLNPFRRMRQLDHLLSVFFFILVLIFWITMVPGLGQQIADSMRSFQPEEKAANYLMRLFLFPLRSVAAGLPWCLLAWPAFCLAFRPLEKQPVFAQFLRTILLWIFIGIWLLPDGRVRSLAPLAVPLGILVGINYDILVRRHGDALMVLAKGISWATLVAALVAGCWQLYVLVIVAPAVPGVLVLYSSLLMLAIAVVGAIWLLKSTDQVPVWLAIGIAMAAGSLTYGATVRTFEYADSPVRQVAARLERNLPDDVVVYQMISASDFFAAESFYLGRPVRRIMHLTELHSPDETVYLLTRDLVPVTGDRTWLPVTDRIHYRDYELRIWKGIVRGR